MATNCYKCKKEGGWPKDIEFSHKGFKFSVFKSGGRCPDCEAEEWRELFDKLAEGEGFISGTPDNFKINWDGFLNSRIYRYRDQRDSMMDLLRALGVLSAKAKGNWCIVSDSEMSLNPSVLFTHLFFTRVKDAMDYARVEYANALYGWEVRHISEVLSRNVALDRAL